MSVVEDHPILDTILPALASSEFTVSRESECIEFWDPKSEQWYELVVRPIDAPS